jgi:hypothetical protein
LNQNQKESGVYMAKIKNFIVPLVVAGVVTFLPKIVIPKKQMKKKKVIKNIRKDYGIDEDNLFI